MMLIGDGSDVILSFSLHAVVVQQVDFILIDLSEIVLFQNV